MTSITRFILRIRLFFSTVFMRTKIREERGFIYDLSGKEFQKLPMEERGKYVQRDHNKYMENIPKQDEVPNFEVESIELVTPQLFSDDENINALNDENNTNIIPNIADGKESEIIENLESKEKIETKEPLLFEDSETEEDFEIPAFLRRQKN